MPLIAFYKKAGQHYKKLQIFCNEFTTKNFSDHIIEIQKKNWK